MEPTAESEAIKAVQILKNRKTAGINVHGVYS